VALDGVSLGGYLALEVFCRRPEAFGAWGAVQGAFGAARAASYADRLASAVQRAVQRSQRPVRLHIETTDGDVFREGSTLLGARLNDAGVACELSVLPGQHDQVFLREAGTLEMLLWHDRGLS
jgi:dienelactone hydrolase